METGDYATSASSGLGMKRKKTKRRRALRNWTSILGFLLFTP